MSFVIESQLHAWLRTGVILLFRYCDGYKRREKWNKNRKLIHWWAEECDKKKWCFCLVQPTVWARIDREGSKMLTSNTNQYLRPEYLTPLPTTVSFTLSIFDSFSFYIVNHPTVSFMLSIATSLRNLSICRNMYFSTFKIHIQMNGTSNNCYLYRQWILVPYFTVYEWLERFKKDWEPVKDDLLSETRLPPAIAVEKSMASVSLTKSTNHRQSNKWS